MGKGNQTWLEQTREANEALHRAGYGGANRSPQLSGATGRVGAIRGDLERAARSGGSTARKRRRSSGVAFMYDWSVDGVSRLLKWTSWNLAEWRWHWSESVGATQITGWMRLQGRAYDLAQERRKQAALRACTMVNLEGVAGSLDPGGSRPARPKTSVSASGPLD